MQITAATTIRAAGFPAALFVIGAAEPQPKWPRGKFPWCTFVYVRVSVCIPPPSADRHRKMAVIGGIGPIKSIGPISPVPPIMRHVVKTWPKVFGYMGRGVNKVNLVNKVGDSQNAPFGNIYPVSILTIIKKSRSVIFSLNKFK
jgi:hypothetical protein